MFKRLISIPKPTIISLFLLAFFWVEALNKLQFFIWDNDFMGQKLVKLFALGFMLCALFIHQKKALLTLLIVAVGYSLGQFFLVEDAFSVISVIGFSRYFFFLSLIIYASKLQSSSIKLLKVYEGLIILNSVIILIAFIGSFRIFQSYPGERFGYNGLFFASSSSTYFYILALVYYLSFYRKQAFKQLGCWLVILAGCCMGTKSFYLSALLILILAIFFFIKNAKLKTAFISTLTLVGVAGAIIFFSSTLFTDVIQKDGWLTAVLSYRDELLLERSIPYIQKHWNSANYLFGGLSDPNTRPQLEYVDLFLYLGLVGVGYYLFSFYKHYFNFSVKSKFVILCFIVLLAVTFITGNFFYNASVPIYLVILKFALINSEQQKIQPSKKTMINRIHILNTNIDNLSMQETLQKVSETIQQQKHLHHTVVNAGKIVALQNDKALRKSVNEADLINADGQAVIWASKMLNKPLKERVAGIDLFTNLLSLAAEKNYKVYLLGAKPEIIERLQQKIKTTYKTEIIAGAHHGYFSEAEETQLVQKIAESGANMLFVAMSSPKKEIFLHKHKQAFQQLNFIMGVGGSFDVLAGKTKRAPLWMQKAGLEWFFRFAQEPQRMWKRYLIGNTKFISLVLKEKFSGKTQNNKLI